MPADLFVLPAASALAEAVAVLLTVAISPAWVAVGTALRAAPPSVVLTPVTLMPLPFWISGSSTVPPMVAPRKVAELM